MCSSGAPLKPAATAKLLPRARGVERNHGRDDKHPARLERCFFGRRRRPYSDDFRFVWRCAAPLLGAAGNGIQSFVLQPPQFGPFLRLHPAGHLVCHDAGVLHRTLHDHLKNSGDSAAVDTLWRFAREGRLYDVALLHQLIRLAEDGRRRPTPMGLSDLALLYANESLPDADPDSARAAIAIRQAEAILKVYSSLYRQLQAPGFIHPDARVAAGFGPLSLAVQVQGAALSRCPSFLIPSR